MTAKRYIRKQYIILFRFQLKYILYILLFLYIGAAVAGYTVYWTTWVTLGEKLANVYPRGRLMYIFHAANLKLFINIMIITPFFVILGILLSHKIAGPIYSIGRYIDGLKNGDYSRGLTLRKRDELKDLAKKISLLRDRLKENRDNRINAADQIISLLEKQNLAQNDLEVIKVKLEQLKV